jgi:hypothetical protein
MKKGPFLGMNSGNIIFLQIFAQIIVKIFVLAKIVVKIFVFTKVFARIRGGQEQIHEAA